MNSSAPARPRRYPPVWLPAALLLALACVWFAARAVHGIHFYTFIDESGHLVGARAIAAGDRLYHDFIDAHGPLAFMVAQGYGAVFGWTEPLDARWASVAFALLAAGAVGTSPALTGATARLWATALFLGLVAAPWIVQSLYLVDYHGYGGTLTAVVLAWLVLPAWLGAPIARWQAAVCGVCLSLICAAAYALAPSALLFAAAAALAQRHRPRNGSVMVALLAGCLAGAAAVLTWLLIYGDLVGYLVFHIVTQQVNYARYIGFGWRALWQSVIPSAEPGRLVQTEAAMTCLAGVLLLAVRAAGWRGWAGLRQAASLACWLLGILMLNFRGSVLFQDGSFLVASAALLAVALPRFVFRNWQPGALLSWGGSFGIGLLLTAIELADRHAITSPFELTRAQIETQPLSSLAVNNGPLQQRIRQALRPGDRLLVLVYEPSVFLTTGVLPMRQFHEYLPWEADYARAPWFGRKRDLCATLAHEHPPAIVYQPWTVWGLYPPESFMPCVPPLLASDYVADPVPTLFVRRDRVPAAR